MIGILANVAVWLVVLVVACRYGTPRESSPYELAARCPTCLR